MDKSSQKSAVEVVPVAAAAVPPSLPEKRDAEVALEKPASAKKMKKEIVAVQTKQKGDEFKKVPPSLKKIETSSSEDASSDSEDVVPVVAAAVPPSLPAKMEKRDAEVALEKPVSAKRMKKEIVAVQTKQKVDEEFKKVSPSLKKIETSSSEDSSSDAEDCSWSPNCRGSGSKSYTSSNDESDSDSDGENTDGKMKDASSDQTERKSDKRVDKTPVANQSTASGSKVIFVGNLFYGIVDEYLYEFFKEAGEVIDVRLAKHEDGSLKGFGHVEFSTSEAAQKALNELNGKKIWGRPVRLDFAHERGKGPERGLYTPNNWHSTLVFENEELRNKNREAAVRIEAVERKFSDLEQKVAALETKGSACSPKAAIPTHFMEPEKFEEVLAMHYEDGVATCLSYLEQKKLIPEGKVTSSDVISWFLSGE